MSDKIIKRLKWDAGIQAYLGNITFAGQKVGVGVWGQKDSQDYKHLRQIAEDVLQSWPKLKPKLFRLVDAEIKATNWMPPRTRLTWRHLQLFSFNIQRDMSEDAKIFYDFSFNVPMLLREDDFIEVMRYLDGSSESAEIRSAL
ncbi:hypothetical protein [Stieleria mannarensis]|uniref:hypothetical protein n=1 Tax=Stieleria mannarensis TaxID=2755585 RepID=UPI0016010C86|nr:hypothetical protein [Rhodopirellula sp. JC639]